MPPKRIKRRRHHHNLRMLANAALAGMKLEKHQSVSRRWGAGEHKKVQAGRSVSHTIWSTTIDGVVIYRASKAALARIYMELLP